MVSRFLQKHDMDLICRAHQVVEDGYEFFSKRQLVTLFSAPNYCGEFDNAGAMMSVDESLLCSFQVRRLKVLYLLVASRAKSPWHAIGSDPLCLRNPNHRSTTLTVVVPRQILKPAEKKQKYVYGGMSTGRPVTPPRKQKNKK